MLSNLIDADRIIVNLEASTKEGVIRELSGLFKQTGVIEDLDGFIEVIHARERLESTAIGDGIAIPHGRWEGVRHIAVAFARSASGVEFEAEDGQPVHLIFMIAAPKDATREYLQAVAKIARFLKMKELRVELSNASTPADVLKAIGAFDARPLHREEVPTKEGRVIYRR